MFQVGYTAGGRLDPPFFPTKTKPYTKGFILEVPPATGPVSIVYNAVQDIELISIAVGASVYSTKDNWYLKHNGEAILETIYTKNLPEGIYLMVAHPIKIGDKLEFLYDNQSGVAKTVWFNYQTLKG